MNKALFLDRDGVIVQGIYDHGHIRTILTPEEIEYIPGIIELVTIAQEKGYKIITISNQPVIGLGQMSTAMFEKISNKITNDMKKYGVTINGEYYCFHHPYAKIEEYKKICNCRKPATGMLMKAAKEHTIDLSQSWFIGDGV